MNKQIYKLLTLLSILFTTACGTKTITENSQAVDQEKLEQIKKILAEQEAATESSEEKTDNRGSVSGSSKIVSLRLKPNPLEFIEQLQDDNLRVIAILASGEEKTLSKDVQFQISNPQCLEIIDDPISARFQVLPKTSCETKVEVQHLDLKLESLFKVKPKQILSLEILPKTLALGSPTRFRLVALFDNNSQADITTGLSWTSNDPTILAANSDSSSTGVFTGIKVSQVGIKVDFQGQTIVSRVQIQMPSLRSLSVQGESTSFLLGTHAPLKAIAQFINGLNFDISSSVSWSSSDLNVATVDANGELDALYPGDVNIKAQYGTFTAEENFNVTSVSFRSYRIDPATASVPVGLNQSFRLIGILPNNTEQDITNFARWTSSQDDLLKAGGREGNFVRGLYAGIGRGQATVMARYGSNTLSIPVQVIDAAVTGIQVKSENPDGPCGVNNPQLSVEATLSDGSSRDLTELVSFSLSPSDAGVMSTVQGQAGLVLSKKPGQVTVSASYTEPSNSQIYRSQLNLQFQAPVATGVGIIGSSQSIAIGQTLQLNAAQLLSCGTGPNFTQNLVWTSSNTLLATVSNSNGQKGLVSTLGTLSQPETITISASGAGFNGTYALTIRPKEVTAISISSLKSSLVTSSETTSFTVNASFTDGSNEDFTSLTGRVGYTLQYFLSDCPTTGCASIQGNTGLLSALSLEGLVKVRAVLNTPDGRVISSPQSNIKIISPCSSPGIRSGYYCVYLSARGASCSSTCSQYAGRSSHPATLSAFGSQGDPLQCADALYDLGHFQRLEVDLSSANKGVGCAIWYLAALGIKKSVRDTAMQTTDTASDADFQRVCACRE